MIKTRTTWHKAFREAGVSWQHGGVSHVMDHLRNTTVTSLRGLRRARDLNEQHIPFNLKSKLSLNLTPP